MYSRIQHNFQICFSAIESPVYFCQRKHLLRTERGLLFLDNWVMVSLVAQIHTPDEAERRQCTLCRGEKSVWWHRRRRRGRESSSVYFDDGVRRVVVQVSVGLLRPLQLLHALLHLRLQRRDLCTLTPNPHTTHPQPHILSWGRRLSVATIRGDNFFAFHQFRMQHLI